MTNECSRQRHGFDGRLPPPVTATLETTRFCNLACPMCQLFIDGTTVVGPHMPMDQFEWTAHQLFPFIDRFQPSVSGEPLVTRHFDKMLGVASRYGVKMDMVTNGMTLDDQMIGLILPVLGSIMVSLDGATADTFERIRAKGRIDRVLGGLRALMSKVREIPDPLRPVTGLNCTLMKANAGELAAIIRIAADLGLDHVDVNHLYPLTEEMRQQSLARDVDLARRSIDEAIAAAEECGICLKIAALDELTVAAAYGGDGREVSHVNGVVSALGEIEMNGATNREFPSAAPRSEIVESDRAYGRTRSYFVAPGIPLPRAPENVQESIYTCDFLWQRTYVHLFGEVRPCCVAGAPLAGNVQYPGRFDAVWNNRVHRTMRQRLVAKDPVPVCRGCRHAREVSDQGEIRWLLGGAVPMSAEELEPLPRLLDAEEAGAPIEREVELLEEALADEDPLENICASGSANPTGQVRQLCSADTPTIFWEGAHEDAYRIEAVVAGEGPLYVTEALEGQGLAYCAETMAFDIPEAIWSRAEVGTRYQWEVINVSDGRRCAHGSVEKF